jgi:uncharacterized protein YndB with AHSA1/START domain
MASRLEIVAPPDEPTIRTRRVVDAPRALVYEMFTRSEHVQRWIGPRRMSWAVCEMDVRPGGAWRWVMRDPDGREYRFHGVFREVEPPTRIVRTFVYDPFPEGDAVETLLLTEKDGKTIVESMSTYRTVAARDAHLRNGMEKGMTEGYEQLDELLLGAGGGRGGRGG